MAQRIQSIDEFQRYLRGVMDRAYDHAGNVTHIVLALAGAVVLFKDEGTEIEVRTQDGELKNVLWMRIGSRRYMFRYNHDVKAVEVRDRTREGIVIRQFTNATPADEIVGFFRLLKSMKD